VAVIPHYVIHRHSYNDTALLVFSLILPPSFHHFENYNSERGEKESERNRMKRSLPSASKG